MKGRGWLKKEAVQKKNCAASISITRICFDIKMKLQQLVKKLVHKNNNLIPKLIFLFWCKWMYFYCLDLYPNTMHSGEQIGLQGTPFQKRYGNYCIYWRFSSLISFQKQSWLLKNFTQIPSSTQFVEENTLNIFFSFEIV